MTALPVMAAAPAGPTPAAAAAAACRPVIAGDDPAALAACLAGWRRMGLAAAAVLIGPRPSRQPGPLLHLPDPPPADAADRLAAFLAATGASGIAAADAVTGRWLGEQATALPAGCRLWAPAAAALAGLADRTQQVEAARAVGLDVPPTYVVRAALAGSVPKGQFPVVARPLDATTAAGIGRRFARRGDLAAQLRKAGTLAPPLVVQPHRPGALLLVRGCRGHDGGVFALDAFLAERTLHGRPVSLRPAPLPPRLAARCAAFADAGGLTGPFELAFTVAAGRLWFDEAAYGFGRAGRLAMRLGYDLPRHLLVAHGAALRPPTPDSVAAACAVDRRTLLRHGRALLADRLPALDRRSDDSRWRLLASDLGDLIGGRGA